MLADARNSRHLALFGETGQTRISASTVTVVGASGLGTPTLMYLAFLRLKRINIIDPGYLKLSSHNRNFAVHDSDSANTTLKVDIAARMVQLKSPETTLCKIPERLESKAAFAAIENSDFVFGCLDCDGARFVLNEVCLAYDKPLIDMASDVQSDGSEFGGRVAVVGQHGCLYCLGLLDETDIRRYLSSSLELSNEADAYGIPMDYLSASTGPSVATINGIVAGLGVTEFWVNTIGLRSPHRSIIYLGTEAAIRRSVDPPSHDCFYCTVVRGQGHASGVRRHIARFESDDQDRAWNRQMELNEQLRDHP